MTLQPRHPGRLPVTLRAAALLGLAWNSFGLSRFAATEFASEAELVADGMTAAQAALYAALPAWMAIAFAVGVLGGAAGSALMLLRRRAAVPVLGASLTAYVVLFVSDITQGVFAAFGAGQVALLGLVVAVAAALLALARRGDRAGFFHRLRPAGAGLRSTST